MAYNGWKNYETWNVYLWVGNDEPLYRAMQEELRKVGKFTAVSAQRWTMEQMPNGTPDFKSAKRYDLVDWEEIANAYNE